MVSNEILSNNYENLKNEAEWARFKLGNPSDRRNKNSILYYYFLLSYAVGVVREVS